jgi:hypothetical protein
MKSKIYNALKGVMFKDKTKDDYTSELVNIAEEFAIEFAFFIGEHTYTSYSNGTWSNDFGDENLTTKELLEIYKKEKGL